MEKLLEVAGRVHPVVVHLPIGFLFLAAVFVWLKDIPRRVLFITFGLSAAASLVAVMSGLLLVEYGEYDDAGVELHRNFGIIVLLISAHSFYAIQRAEELSTAWKVRSIVIVAAIVVTGHLGGNITHGEGYLLEPLLADDEEAGFDIATINLDSSRFYSDAVAPIFESRCNSCHGSTRQKGGLRLDSEEHIVKGGKNGVIIEAGNTAESELVKRIDLPLEDEDHMPPRERTQLTEQERKLISLWVESGADFRKTMIELATREKLAEIVESTRDDVRLPDVEVSKPDQQLMDELTEQGVSISRVAQKSDFLQVNFISIPERAEELLPKLKPIASNIVSLKLSGARLEPQSIEQLTACTNLMTLVLSGTNVGDEDLKVLSNCKSLVTLNLGSTSVTMGGLYELQKLKMLRKLNLFNTGITNQEAVRSMFPGVEVELGGYTVPALPGDTIVIKTN